MGQAVVVVVLVAAAAVVVAVVVAAAAVAVIVTVTVTVVVVAAVGKVGCDEPDHEELNASVGEAVDVAVLHLMEP